MQKRKKSEHYLKAGIDILFVVASFLGAVWLAKRHIAINAGFFSLKEGELFFLLFLCLAWIITARIVGLYDEFRTKALGFELRAVGENNRD